MSKTSGRRLMAIPSRIRAAGRVPWRALSRTGRISVAGVIGSAALAVALGIIIPRVVEHYALASRLESIVSLVRILEQQDLVPPAGEDLTREAYDRFDATVRGGLLGGENLRVKLWNREGEIVYSDRLELVGRRFPIEPSLALALSGRATSELSELSARENDLDRELGVQALEFYVPLHGSRGEVIGAFEVYQDAARIAGPLTAVQRAVWVSIGTGLSVLLVFLVLLFAATSRTMERESAARERLLRRLVHAQEEERRHVVGDLHDEVGQTLTRVLYGIRGSRARLGADGSDVAQELQRLERLVDHLILVLRRFMAEAGPALIDDFGLAAALQALAREQEAESGVLIEVVADEVPELDQVTQITLLRAAREAVINARKHAEPNRMRIVLGRSRSGVTLAVEDDGRGSARIRDGVGLRYLRDRVASIGGRVDVTSRPEVGTRLYVQAPIGGRDGSDPDPRR